MVVLVGPDTGPLEVQATANANNGTPMLMTARARRRPRLEPWKPDLIVTEWSAISSSIAPRRTGGGAVGTDGVESQLAAALLPLAEPPPLDEPDDEPLADEPPLDEPLPDEPLPDEPLPDEPLPELDGFDPPDESPDPLLVAAALESVR